MRYHRGMGQLLVRNVPDEAIAALKRQAAKNGRSMEAEARELLKELASPAPKRDWLAEADRLRERTKGRGGPPAWVLIREDRDSR